jgi:putative hydrolase of the HAD superfamily
MPVRAVLFDLGNTLWHIPAPPPVEQIRHATVSRILDLLRSWDVEVQEQHRFLGRDIRLTIAEAEKQAYETDQVSPDYVAIARKVARETGGLDLGDDRAEELWHAWNLGGDFFGRQLYDDTLETLDTLRSRGYRLACVTNRAFGGPAFVDEVEQLGLTPYFESLAVSCEVGYMKPHKLLFEHALGELGVSGSEALHVGDSLVADVRGAQALGMTAVWRVPRKKLDEPSGIQPDFTIHTLRELLGLPLLAGQ